MQASLYHHCTNITCCVTATHDAVLKTHCRAALGAPSSQVPTSCHVTACAHARLQASTGQHRHAASRATAQQAYQRNASDLQCDVLATFDHLPLFNKRILTTAPRQYASKLTALLVDAGARPTWVPGVAISRLSEPEHLQQLDDSLQQLGSYSHLAFTSRNGILAVVERLAELHGGG
eukprot:GHRQ01010970.1.p1 GENE.GHRQ01010970.1~~GHRQ01010970.1.p1  ORF type:complete len:177 (+),score=37.96 GHRQ01010970.1:1282-1812(+)